MCPEFELDTDYLKSNSNETYSRNLIFSTIEEKNKMQTKKKSDTKKYEILIQFNENILENIFHRG
jgi:hypothetical protein